MKRNSAIIIFFTVFVLVLGIVLAGILSNGQPIRYNHEKHIQQADLECLDCHKNVETSARASIPNIETCSECHDDPEDENEEIRKVASYVEEGKRIPWKQVNVVPDYAFFSHRRHVVLAEITCETCHGNVSSMATPFSEPYQEINMDWCMDCHEERKASSDCYACHR